MDHRSHGPWMDGNVVGASALIDGPYVFAGVRYDRDERAIYVGTGAVLRKSLLERGIASEADSKEAGRMKTVIIPNVLRLEKRCDGVRGTTIADPGVNMQ